VIIAGGIARRRTSSSRAARARESACRPLMLNQAGIVGDAMLAAEAAQLTSTPARRRPTRAGRWHGLRRCPARAEAGDRRGYLAVETPGSSATSTRPPSSASRARSDGLTESFDARGPVRERCSTPTTVAASRCSRSATLHDHDSFPSRGTAVLVTRSSRRAASRAHRIHAARRRGTARS